MDIDPRLHRIVAEQPYPLLFATISGAHLYGFPSRDSDYDLCGVHVLPPTEVLGLTKPRETIEISDKPDGLELDLVTHDAKKFFTLLLSRNGYVLEQLYSPLIVLTTAEHAELKAIAQGCITRHHAHHYLGFARNEWRLFEKEEPPRIKPLLYAYRVLLAGIDLMETGKVEANLVRLNEKYRLGHVTDLIARKTAGEERGELVGAEMDFHRSEYVRLTATLERARDASRLPETPTARGALGDLLIRLRLSAAKPREAGIQR